RGRVAAQRPHGVLVAARRAPQAQVDPAGVQRLQGAELLGDGQRGVVGQHHAARTDPDPLGVRGDVRDEHAGGRGRDGRHVVVLGVPDPAVAQPVGGLRQFQAGLQALPGGSPLRDVREVEDGQGGGGTGRGQGRRPFVTGSGDAAAGGSPFAQPRRSARYFCAPPRPRRSPGPVRAPHGRRGAPARGPGGPGAGRFRVGRPESTPGTGAEVTMRPVSLGEDGHMARTSPGTSLRRRTLYPAAFALVLAVGVLGPPPPGAAAEPAPPGGVERFYDNEGISDDSEPDGADLDGDGRSLSAQTLAAAGWGPGDAVTLHGTELRMPDTRPGEPDNAVADGQRVRLSGAVRAVTFLAAATGGDATGTGKIVYRDGSEEYSVTTPDWETGSLATKAVALPYANTPDGPTGEQVRLYAVTVPVDPDRKPTGIELPSI